MDTTAAPDLITPPQPPGPVAWLRKNLFSNWYNSLLTIVLLVFIYWAVSAILRWVFITAIGLLSFAIHFCIWLDNTRAIRSGVSGCVWRSPLCFSG
jgi:hypothetical protein